MTWSAPELCERSLFVGEFGNTAIQNPPSRRPRREVIRPRRHRCRDRMPSPLFRLRRRAVNVLKPQKRPTVLTLLSARSHGMSSPAKPASTPRRSARSRTLDGIRDTSEFPHGHCKPSGEGRRAPIFILRRPKDGPVEQLPFPARNVVGSWHRVRGAAHESP